MLIAIDTETVRDEPWSVQWCKEPGIARMALVERKSESLEALRRSLESSSTLTIVHNALFDLQVLAQVGIHPHKFVDSMVMAYLLGENSIGLKTLSYRYCNMELQSYEEVVREPANRKAKEYLNKVISMEWPDPAPVLEIRPNGDEHVKFPHHLTKRLSAYLKKHEAGTAAKSLTKYWKHKDRVADRAMVEPVIGKMEPGYLSEIPLSDAIHYACMDADATLRLYPILWSRIVESGQEGVFWRDMGMIPMVIDMMQAGIRINKEHFYGLEKEYDRKAEALLERITGLNEGYLNPGSSVQVLEALRGRGLNIRSTDAKELDAHRGDELVRPVQDYRGYKKLNSTYIGVLPNHADNNDRVHTNFSITRTATGRLASSNPNLQNQPVRNEDGRRIREGFVAERRI